MRRRADGTSSWFRWSNESPARSSSTLVAMGSGGDGRERRTLVATGSGGESLATGSGGDGERRRRLKGGEVTAGQNNTLSARWHECDGTSARARTAHGEPEGSELGRRGPANLGEASAGEVTAGQTNTLSVRWDQRAISARVCARRRSLRPAGWTVGRTGRQLALSRAGDINLSTPL